VAALHRRGIIFSIIGTPWLGHELVAVFKQAGLSIAMGNAARAVQRAPDVVTDSNREDGFAHAIERFVLGRAQSGAVVDIARAGVRG